MTGEDGRMIDIGSERQVPGGLARRVKSIF